MRFRICKQTNVQRTSQETTAIFKRNDLKITRSTIPYDYGENHRTKQQEKTTRKQKIKTKRADIERKGKNNGRLNRIHGFARNSKKGMPEQWAYIALEWCEIMINAHRYLPNKHNKGNWEIILWKFSSRHNFLVLYLG